MLVLQNVLDALKQIGLNLYERKLWVALLSRGTATAGELSSLGKVPHSRTYDVLESLAEKGFVMIQTSKPLRYMAIAPKEALERAKKKLKNDFEVTAGRINRLQRSSTFKDLERLYKKGFKLVEPGNMTGSLRGRNAFYQQLESVFRNAKSNISILITSKGLSELYSEFRDLLRRAASKGVKIKIATFYGKDNAEILEDLKSFAEVRKANKSDIMGRFFVIDNSHVIMALTDEDVHPTQDLALWSQSDHIAKGVMGPMFKLMWQNLEPA